MFHKFALFVLVLYCLSGCAAPARKPVTRPTQPPPVVKSAPPAGKPAPPSPISPSGIPIPPEIPVPPVVPKPLPPLVRLPTDQFPLFTDDMDLASLETALRADARDQ